MYAIDLIRRVPGSEEPEIVIISEPDAKTQEAAIAAGHRVFSSRGAEMKAEGFLVTRRGSGEVVCTWYADA